MSFEDEQVCFTLTVFINRELIIKKKEFNLETQGSKMHVFPGAEEANRATRITFLRLN